MAGANLEFKEASVAYILFFLRLLFLRHESRAQAAKVLVHARVGDPASPSRCQLSEPEKGGVTGIRRVVSERRGGDLAGTVTAGCGKAEHECWPRLWLTAIADWRRYYNAAVKRVFVFVWQLQDRVTT
ncbi:hypothetical protein BC835DRAFT_544087 [Cytidiella melzeri]|nr:hypothetical protein BC835DRAFT_544087 [Cytidiella melzeri]